MRRPIRPLPIRHVTPEAASRWRLAQWVVLLGTLLLLVALPLWPTVALAVVWRGAIPVLALVLLLAPHAWRNVCPLATASLVGRDITVGAPLRGESLWRWSLAAIAIFLAAVILRRGVFEASGAATSGLIGGALLVAGTVGRSAPAKAGFCNTICPVGPVERLLGQFAVVNPGNPRCPTCTLCTPRGCLDLALDKAPAQLLGRSRRDRGWLLDPWGAFGASFPGIVLGWGVAGALGASLPLTALAIIGGAAGSWLLSGILAVAGVTSTTQLRLNALLAAATYAGFAWPAVITTWRGLLGG